MKTLIFSICALMLASCTSLEYRKPIRMEQSNIRNMYVDSKSLSESIGAGKYENCAISQEIFHVNECSVIICKDNLSTQTKLECDVYLPATVTGPSDQAILERFNTYFTKYLTLDQVDLMLSQNYEIKNNTVIANFCLRPDVYCFKDSKEFPNNKTSRPVSFRIVFKKTYYLKDNSMFEVTLYED